MERLELRERLLIAAPISLIVGYMAALLIKSEYLDPILNRLVDSRLGLFYAERRIKKEVSQLDDLISLQKNF